VLEHRSGPLLVEGGFGTGKTRVLRERFLELVASSPDADRVVLVLGSGRARDEARRAILSRLPGSLPSLRITTMHGLAYQVVSARYHALGYTGPPTILASGDQFAKVQELLAGEDPADWPAYGGLLRLRGFADQIRQLVVRAQESLLRPEDIQVAAAARGLGGWIELAAFYGRYLDVLGAEGAVDFGGLTGQAALAAERDEPLFDHVLVDDLQDTTLAAERLLAALRPSSLVVTGNPEAHVFSFQGTTDLPLSRFAERFSATSVRLDVVHRGADVTIEARAAGHTSEEHAAVARELRWVHAHDGVSWRDLAIVARRQGGHLPGLLRALDDAGVPRHVPESGLALSAEAATVPYTLALRWIARPAERDALVEPVLASELGELSPAAARGLIRAARAAGRPIADALEIVEGLSTEEADRLRRLREILRDAEARSASVVDSFRELWERLPFSARLVSGPDDSELARRDLDAVMALSRAIERMGESGDASVRAFVDLLEAGEGGPGVSGIGDSEADAVQVLTAHGATGLEFDTVIVVGAVEGDFPSLERPEPMFDLSLLEAEATRSERLRRRLSEEHRLFASVLGRARRRVLLTASDPHGIKEAARSRFVDELGLAWVPMRPASEEPVSVAEAAAAWRRELADGEAASFTRLAAIDGLLALGVEPSRWWFQRDWTDTGAPLHETLRLSYSRLATLDNCELQFVLGEELGLSKRGGHQAAVGKLVHELIDECENGLIERSQEALVAALDARWNEGWFPSRAVSRAFHGLAIDRLIPNWVRNYGSLPASASEVAFAFEFDGATIAGKIDRIGPHDAGFRITDFKTGKAENAPKAAESLQLGIYYLAVTSAPELAAFRPVRAVDLVYLRGHWRTGEVGSQAWPISPAGEEEYQASVRQTLSGLIDRIRTLDAEQTYRPDPAAQCHFCDFKPLCSLYPEGQPLFPVEGLEPSVPDAGVSAEVPA
jgi:superfamily I DNA/RNA helicase